MTWNVTSGSRTSPRNARRLYRPWVEALEMRILPSRDLVDFLPRATAFDMPQGGILARHQMPAVRVIGHAGFERKAAPTGPEATAVKGLYRTLLRQRPADADLRKSLRFLQGGGT